MELKNQVCFGVEPRPDGSVIVAKRDARGTTVDLVGAGPSQSARVVDLVRQAPHAPRVCVADGHHRALNLALAIGALDDAEVMLVRPESVGGAGPLAPSLAWYAHRAA